MKKSKKKNKEYYNLKLTFRYVCINIEVNKDFYSDKDKAKFLDILYILTQEICIDKSYVEFANTKYEKTFITDIGWNELCKLVIDTEKKVTKKQNDEKIEAYIMLILSYLYMCFDDLGYNTEHIFLEVDDDSYFMAEHEKDESNYWLTYPGKWQTWKWYK